VCGLVCCVDLCVLLCVCGLVCVVVVCGFVCGCVVVGVWTCVFFVISLFIYNKYYFERFYKTYWYTRIADSR
jgi:hypothetical protein